MNDFYKYLRNYILVYLPTLKNFSVNTVNSYRNSLNLFLDYVAESHGIGFADINFETVTYDTLKSYVEMLEKNGMSSATINARLSAIRSFYEYVSTMDHSLMAYRQEIIKVPFRKINRLSKSLEYLERNQISDLLKAPDRKNDVEFRDMIMMMTLYDGAFRVSELRSIKISDVKFARISSIVVLGKGGKYRNVPISDKTAEGIKIYIARIHKNPESDSYLYYPGEDEGRKMSDDNVNRILKKYAARAESISDPCKVRCHMILIVTLFAKCKVKLFYSEF